MSKQQRDGVQKVGHEIAVGDGVQAIGTSRSEAQGSSQSVTVDGVGGSGQRPRTQRALIGGSCGGPAQPVMIAFEHGDVTQQPVGGRDRLGGLEVSQAGHDAVGMSGGLGEQSALQLADVIRQDRYGAYHPQAQIDGDLIVAAAAGVQLAGDRADGFCQAAFDSSMDVFIAGGRGELPGVKALADGLCSAEEGVRLHDALETAFFLRAEDPVWAEEHRADLPAQLRANAALYAISEPTDSWLGISSEASVREIRDLTRCLTISPIDVVRWTRAGMPCLRRGALARWDVQQVTAWLSEQGIMPAQRDLRELDQTECFVCQQVAAGEATADEGYEALSGWVGVM